MLNWFYANPHYASISLYHLKIGGDLFEPIWLQGLLQFEIYGVDTCLRVLKAPSIMKTSLRRFKRSGSTGLL